MIYVASSWRNPRQLEVVERLRAEGFEVFDFRNPAPGNRGFHWSEIDPNWQSWTAAEFRERLRHPLAVEGFAQDFGAMEDSDTFVLVLPAGASAHLEIGWASGSGWRTIALLADGEPELMYGLLDYLCVDLDEVVFVLKHGCYPLRSFA